MVELAGHCRLAASLAFYTHVWADILNGSLSMEGAPVAAPQSSKLVCDCALLPRDSTAVGINASETGPAESVQLHSQQRRQLPEFQDFAGYFTYSPVLPAGKGAYWKPHQQVELSCHWELRITVMCHVFVTMSYHACMP